MMDDSERERAVADERTLEQRYSDELIDDERRHRENILRIVTPNTLTASLPTDPVKGGHLVGRIKLGRHNGLIGADDFYIGTASYDRNGYRVYSWTAPIAARAFYRKGVADRPGSAAFEALCADVEGVRSFTHHADKIHDLQDEWLDGDHPDVTMFAPVDLVVPKAPARPVVAAPPTLSDAAPIPNEEENTRSAIDQVGSPAPPPTQKSTGPGQTSQPKPPGPPIRAAALLGRQLAAPKQSAMSTVLATLQPDQYEAITALATSDQILQGHPGTGKTIVAVHRAAYLLSEHEQEEPDDARARGSVLIIGPTEEYVAHVSKALRKLTPDARRYQVTSLPGLLEDLAGLPRTGTPTETSSYLDVDLELARLVDHAFAREMGRRDGMPEPVNVYATLLGFLADPPNGVLEPEWTDYLRSLPGRFADLKQQRRRAHRGLMAYIGVRTSEPPTLGHVIIDEAQDIHPLEWEALARLGNRGGWTILGDLNQRRTDHTFSSWEKVAERLAIDADGRAPVKILERGYRSTAQIIQYANQLLPKDERVLYSLQRGGQAPSLRKASSAGELFTTALTAAVEMHDQVTPGTTAIVSADYERMRAQMPKSGWKADLRDPSVWRNGDRVLRVLPAERARGLEFDAVVVVEPSAFPELFGRKGVLYTALTRANRLLTVVHHRALPEQLRRL
ncbi:AAA family ATPase [Pseudolysinimonas sp.]